MSIINTNIPKQPLKVIEVPLSKFKEEVIPHHQKLFEQHKTIIMKLISVSNVEQAHREIKNKKRVVKQLRDLMYELDTLRAQVEDSDLDKFDTKTLSLRKLILNLVTNYTDLENTIFTMVHNQTSEEASIDECDPFEGAAQIQLHENLQEVKLKQRQEVLNEVETINRDVEDLHEAYTQLNQMVDEQKVHVDQVEESVESTHVNVHSGLKQLVKAHRIRTAAYPVTGAFLGGIIGGPIGLVAGLKVGGIAALTCALAGYTGGKFFKKSHETENVPSTDEIVDCPNDSSEEKKDI